MKSIETSGKTVEDAVKVGLKELNCDLADVQIDVIDAGSPGLFGMFGRLAKVRMTVKEDEALDLMMPKFSLDAQEEPKKKQPKPEVKKPEPKPEVKKPESKPEMKKPELKPAAAEPAQSPVQVDAAPAPKADRPPRPEREPRQDREPRRDPRPPRGPKPPKAQKPIDPTPISIEARDLPPLDLSALSDVGKSAHEFLYKMTTLMNVPVEIRMEETPEHLEVQMIGDELGVLIGRRGDTLDALQYLTSLQVNKDQSKYVRVTLDTEHYRAKRADALTKLAGRMAARVAKTGHRVALEPMNPYERRILHSALQGHPNVTTHSEGEEPYRRVVITMK